MTFPEPCPDCGATSGERWCPVDRVCAEHCREPEDHMPEEVSMATHRGFPVHTLCSCGYDAQLHGDDCTLGLGGSYA